MDELAKLHINPRGRVEVGAVLTALRTDCATAAAALLADVLHHREAHRLADIVEADLNRHAGDLVRLEAAAAHAAAQYHAAIEDYQAVTDEINAGRAARIDIDALQAQQAAARLAFEALSGPRTASKNALADMRGAHDSRRELLARLRAVPPADIALLRELLEVDREQ